MQRNQELTQRYIEKSQRTTELVTNSAHCPSVDLSDNSVDLSVSFYKLTKLNEGINPEENIPDSDKCLKTVGNFLLKEILLIEILNTFPAEFRLQC